jgi:LPS export ABC transporter protein LptC
MALVLSASCSFVAQDTDARPKPAQHPDLQLTDGSYTLSQAGTAPVTVVAKNIEIYGKAHKALMDNLSFTQYDSDGVLKMQGKADYCSLDTDSYSAQLDGNIFLELPERKFSIDCSSLDWDNSSKVLSSTKGKVSVTFNGNDTITGTGFSGNLATRTFEFATLEKGELHEE